MTLGCVPVVWITTRARDVDRRGTSSRARGSTSECRRANASRMVCTVASSASASVVTARGVVARRRGIVGGIAPSGRMTTRAVAASRAVVVMGGAHRAGCVGRAIDRSMRRMTTTTTTMATGEGIDDVKAENAAADVTETELGGNVRQLLGFKGAAETDDVWKIRVQLTKPGTWVPLIWGVMCGSAASGHYEWNLDNVGKALLCMTMSGPFLTGYTQTINDWYDREIDAINEPYRPIPSGAISENEVKAQIAVLLVGGWLCALQLDRWCEHDIPVVFLLSLFGSYISYIYSAPPLKLKAEGWKGCYALGSSYIALPWWAGMATFGTLTPDVMFLTVLYSIAGLGIAIVNDFKSIEGDRKLGLQSLPVAFGVEKAKWITVSTIDITQLFVAFYLRAIGEETYSNVLLCLIFPQIFFQFKFFLPDPMKNDVKYQASAQPFLVFGLLTTGLAWGHHINALGM